jgi:hypothetical protein
MPAVSLAFLGMNTLPCCSILVFSIFCSMEDIVPFFISVSMLRAFAPGIAQDVFVSAGVA